MQAKKNIAIFARQFWPTTSDASLRLRSWARQLELSDWNVHVITPRWHREWPAVLPIGNMLVHRIDDPPTNALRHRKFGKNIAKWLTENRSWVDLLYFDFADQMASVIVGQLKRTQRPPAVVRFCDSQANLSQRPTKPVLDTCRRADAVIASGPHANRILRSQGIPDQRILRDLDRAHDSFSRTEQERRTARQVLRGANYDLNVKHTNRVVVCLNRFESARDATLLARAHQFIDGHPEVRIWMVGDGPARPAMYEALKHEGVHRSVVMPGMFVSLKEVIQAADLCLIHSAREGENWFLPTCLRSGVAALFPTETLAIQPTDVAQKLVRCTYDAQSSADMEAGLMRWLANQSDFNTASRTAASSLPAKVDLSVLRQLID